MIFFQEKHKVWMALFTTVSMWASGFIGVRFALTGFSPTGLALFRLTVAAVFLLLCAFIRPSQKHIPKKDILQAMGLGVIGMGVYHGFLNLGSQTVTAGVASFLIAQVPIFTTLMAMIFFKEKVSFIGILGLFISFCGMILIAFGEIQESKFDMGVLYILVSTVASSLYITMGKKVLNKMSSFYFTVFLILGGCTSLLSFLPRLLEDLSHVQSTAILWAVYLGIFPTALAYLIYNYALGKTTGSKAASWLYVMPILTSFLGWLFLGELPTLMAFLGGVLALFGTVLVAL